MLLAGLSAGVQAQTLPAKVAIIIDDIGYQKADPMLIQLPYALTFAVMPFAPQSQQMAELAARLNKEVMLHMPMEAVAQNHLLGKGALRRTMSKAQVQQALYQALAEIPQAIGVNNHMGSLYTSLPEQMNWIMQVMAEKGLYFIDSKTTSRSAVARATHAHQIKSRSRDIFLDNDKSTAALDKQFNQLIKIAKQQGSAIAIGHPYPETYRYLKRNLPRLAAAGIELVPASQLLELTPVAGMSTVSPAMESATETASIPTVRNEGKKVVKLSPQPISTRQADPPGSGSISLVQQPSAAASTASPTSKLPELVTPIAEPLPWHPPYRADLPGLVMPVTDSKEDWQLWFEEQREVSLTTSAPMGMHLLLMR